MTAGWNPTQSYPIPPANALVVSSFMQGVMDLRWDDPALLAQNTAYSIAGVNIYRSNSTDAGPFVRINEYPIESTFYRDQLDFSFVEKELVNWDSSWVYKGDGPNARTWMFKTQFRMVKRQQVAPRQTPTFADSPSDCTVYVNGQEVLVHSVFGRTGEVTLVNVLHFNPETEQYDDLGLPSETDVVEVSYYAQQNFIPSGLGTSVWYRISTVVFDSTEPSGYSETPLARCKPFSIQEVEALDYIWREAVRRNNWILQQGGERVNLFVQKSNGPVCDCTRRAQTLEWNKQPEKNCLKCYGVGIVGGYDGPFTILVAPDDAERRISQGNRGRRVEHSYEVWTGPSPFLTQRDFLVKQTNERYAIGPVRRPTNRGNVLQQHFQIGYIDESDIRYTIPIDGVADLVSPETRGQEVVMPRLPVDGSPSVDEQEGWSSVPFPEGNDTQILPVVTEKSGTTDSTEQRGRTRVWENINY